MCDNFLELQMCLIGEMFILNFMTQDAGLGPRWLESDVTWQDRVEGEYMSRIGGGSCWWGTSGEMCMLSLDKMASIRRQNCRKEMRTYRAPCDDCIEPTKTHHSLRIYHKVSAKFWFQSTRILSCIKYPCTGDTKYRNGHMILITSHTRGHTIFIFLDCIRRAHAI